MEDLLLTLTGLFFLALVAGIIDTMAGGGGLLVVPGLMAAGLDPVSALATNKVQAPFGPFSALLHFRRKGHLKIRSHLLPGLAAFVGSISGAALLVVTDPALLKKIVPGLLILVALWVLFSPKLGDVERKNRISAAACALTLIPAIGFYDGFFGPGTGTFFAIGLVSLLGVTLNEATVRAKFYNLASNLGGLSFFIFSGHIVWVYGLAMLAGSFIGGNIGARLVLRHGSALIRPVLVAVSLAISAKLLLT